MRAWLTVPGGSLDRRGCLPAKTTAELAWEDEASLPGHVDATTGHALSSDYR